MGELLREKKDKDIMKLLLHMAQVAVGIRNVSMSGICFPVGGPVRGGLGQGGFWEEFHHWGRA